MEVILQLKDPLSRYTKLTTKSKYYNYLFVREIIQKTLRKLLSEMTYYQVDILKLLSPCQTIRSISSESFYLYEGFCSFHICSDHPVTVHACLFQMLQLRMSFFISRWIFLIKLNIQVPSLTLSLKKYYYLPYSPRVLTFSIIDFLSGKMLYREGLSCIL